jgi:cell division protein FtsW (lipid II flippase)
MIGFLTYLLIGFFTYCLFVIQMEYKTKRNHFAVSGMIFCCLLWPIVTTIFILDAISTKKIDK